MNLLKILNTRYFLIFILLIGAFLRFYYLTHQSFWQDEIYTANLVTGPFWEQLKFAWYDETHPPLYIFLLKIWVVPFGYSEFSMRACSATLGTLALIPFYHLIRLISSQSIASLSVFLFAISPFAIYYSQEVRCYVLWIPLAIGSYYYFFQWLYNSKNTYYLWAFITILAFYTHIYTLVLALSQLMIFIFELYDKGVRNVLDDKQKIRNFLGSNLLIVLALIPLVGWAYQHMGEESGFSKPFTLSQFAYVIYAWTYGFSLGPSVRELHLLGSAEVLSQWGGTILVSLVSVFIILAFAFSEIIKDRRQKIIFFVLFSSLILIASSPLYSGINFNVRSSLFLVPFYYMYLGMGIEKILHYKYLWVVPCLMIYLMLFSLAQYYTVPKYARDDVRSTMSFLLQKPEIPILTSEMMQKNFLRFYGARNDQDVEMMSWETIKKLSSFPRIWLVWNRPWIIPNADEYQKYFEENFEVLEEKEFPGVKVQLVQDKARGK